MISRIIGMQSMPKILLQCMGVLVSRGSTHFPRKKLRGDVRVQNFLWQSIAAEYNGSHSSYVKLYATFNLIRVTSLLDHFCTATIRRRPSFLWKVTGKVRTSDHCSDDWWLDAVSSRLYAQLHSRTAHSRIRVHVPRTQWDAVFISCDYYLRAANMVH